MIVEVLLSCMHRNSVEEVKELVNRTNIKGKCIVVSQCDREEIIQDGNVKIIFTKQRGLSRSRNLALQNSSGDICLLCDDDEILCDNYEEIIRKTYNNLKEQFICFYISRPARPIPQNNFHLSYRTFWHVASIEISFQREYILNNAIKFDERIGSGVSNCGGEENKFLLDCLKHGLRGSYIPITIGNLIIDSPSQWFKGYNKSYFIDRSRTDKIILGPVLGRIFSLYFLYTKRKLIKQTNPEINWLNTIWILLK